MISYEIVPLEEAKDRFLSKMLVLNSGRGFEMNACLLDRNSKGKCVLAIEEGDLLGWAYTYHDWHVENEKRVHYCPLHVFVSETRRREGIGKSLVDIAKGIVKRWRRKPVAWPHDAIGIAFFDAIDFDLTPP